MSRVSCSWRSIVNAAIAGALLLTIIGTGPGSGAALAAATSDTLQQRYFFSTIYPAEVTCGDEPVLVSGEVHIVGHLTADAHGGGRGVLHSNLQNASGVGLVSGTPYRVVTIGNIIDEPYGAPLPMTFTIQMRVLLVAPDAGNNYVVTHRFHVTVGLDGEVTSIVEDFSSECR